MRTDQTILFCAVIVFLLNFPRVVIFIGQPVQYLYWGALAIIIILSFNKITIKIDTKKDK